MKPNDRFSFLRISGVARYLFSGAVLPPDYRSGGAEPLSICHYLLGWWTKGTPLFPHPQPLKLWHADLTPIL